MSVLLRPRVSLLGVGVAAATLLLVAGWALLPVEEISGTVDDVGSDYVVLEDTRFAVNGDTEFEGYARLSDVQTGDQAEVEYETRGGENVALGIERGAEMTGTVDEVGSGYLVIDGTRFAVGSGVEFEEGYGDLSDVQSGDRAEVEYEMRSGEHVALGLEKGGDDGEDEDDDEGDY